MGYSYLSINDIAFSYIKDQSVYEVINKLSFSIKEGEFISIVGSSGCGKTTLLNIIGGILKPTKGSITNYNKVLPNDTFKIAYMFQKDNLLPWYTVKQNIKTHLKLSNSYNKKTLEDTYELLNKYNLIKYTDHFPKDLSVGMYQKVALILALVQKPDLLLLDEPLSSLDYNAKMGFYDDFFNIIKCEGKTAIMVTHNIEEAVMCSDKIITLNSNPCRVSKSINVKFKGISPIVRRKNPEFINYVDEIIEGVR